MEYKNFYLLFLVLIVFTSCVTKPIVIIKNDSNRTRDKASVTILLSELSSKTSLKFTSINFKNTKNGKLLSSQFVDEDGDGEKESVLFQPTLEANTEIEYEIIFSNVKLNLENNNLTTYSRFVPERIDDYAWENDRVAFRTFGPKAQLLFEKDSTEGKDTGTISSGIDCWLKRVDYSIIDKWYKKYTENTGSYHLDTGEGLDSYHVGKSRGCGGIGVWDSIHNKLIVSKNFTTWKTIDKGPFRTRFQLHYAPWEAKGKIIKETKIISLDLGSHLSKYEIDFSGSDTVNEITVGLTLHENSGIVHTNAKEGWFSYWETIKGDDVGTGIVVDPKYIVSYNKYLVEDKDKSHLFVHLKPIDGKIVYYMGYGWVKSNYFSNKKEWNAYLSVFAKNLQSPLVIKLTLSCKLCYFSSDLFTYNLLYSRGVLPSSFLNCLLK